MNNFGKRLTHLILSCKSILQNKGYFSLIPYTANYIITSFLKVNKMVICNNNVSQMPSLDTIELKHPNVEIKVINGEQELKSMQNAGYNFSFYTNLLADMRHFENGALLISFFIEKRLACKGWLALTDKAIHSLASYAKSINYKNGAIMELCATAPEYRNRGLFTYLTCYCSHYANNKGKDSLISIVNPNNTSALRARETLGGKYLYKGYWVRILYFWDLYYFKRIENVAAKN